MFSEEIITALKNRVGWRIPSDSVYGAFIDSELNLSDSGLNFQGWHKSVTIQNIYETQPNKDIEEVQFKDYLLWLEDQIIRKSIRAVFNNYSTCCDSEKDYSDKLLANISVMDEVIGLCMAIEVLELITTSVRSNFIERIGKHNYEKYKSDLEGYFDSSGRLIVKGLRQKYLDQVISTSSKFCRELGEIKLRDKTNYW